MMKWIVIVVLAALVGGSWMLFDKTDQKMKALQTQIDEIDSNGDPEDLLKDLNPKLQSLEGEKTFNGILLTFLCAGLVGIVFVVYLLPFFAQRVTHAVYDSAEVVEKDAMHDARSLMAQGDYEGAIAAFQQAATVDPLNRLPWVEIAKIQKDNLGDSGAAIQTIRHALESQAWEVNDAAYFLFRLAELYDEVEGDRASAVAIMNQVVEQFPGTRHSANAGHKLHEWEAAAAQSDEAEFIARQQRNQNPPA
ncbi:MAG: tetratricopeptide repeat protein [Verrucomicrobiaceae bacterium]|nr:MAG: tetratricopeptide repeat protein [Verrucomicrobiaceae bacterium]